MRDWKWAALLCSVALGSGPAWAADVLTKAPVRQSYVSPNGDFTLIYDQQVRYVTWESTRGYPTFGSTAAGSGQQLYSPFSLELKSRQHRDWAFDVLVRGGAVDSRQSTPGQSGSYSGWIDTLASGTVTYTGNRFLHPFVSLAMNLPTGQSKLFGDARFARMDPDIVFVPTFGEGLNVGPTAGVVMDFDRDRHLTLAVGYTNRGSYTREDSGTGTLPVYVSPSDETSITAQYRQRLNPFFTYWAGLTYARQTTTNLQLSGVNLQVSPGDRLTANGGLRYTWAPFWHTTVRVSYTHIAATTASDNIIGVLNPGGVNANNAAYYASLEQLYGYGPFGIGLRGSYFHRDQNEYSPTLANFVPAKNRYQVTGFLNLPATPVRQLSLNAELARVWAREAANAGLGTPEINTDAWIATVGVRYAFIP